MGWRDREYAKWTDEERRRYLGSFPSSPRRRSQVRPAASVAVFASAAIVAAGQLPRSHPLLPALRLTLPRHSASAPRTPAVTRLRLLPGATVGGWITFSGTAAPGVVEVDGTYGRRPAWQELASTPVESDGTYLVRIQTARRGLFHVRLLYPDGSRSTGAVRVH